jgi:hypothetical protein
VNWSESLNSSIPALVCSWNDNFILQFDCEDKFKIHIYNLLKIWQRERILFCQFFEGFRAGFLLLVLWCSHIGDCPQEELAKFGYKSERKAENFNAIFWFSTVNPNPLHKYGNFRNLFHEIWWLWHKFLFFSTKILCMSLTGFPLGLFCNNLCKRI